jgi:hypothetical protein
VGEERTGGGTRSTVTARIPEAATGRSLTNNEVRSWTGGDGRSWTVVSLMGTGGGEELDRWRGEKLDRRPGEELDRG